MVLANFPTEQVIEFTVRGWEDCSLPLEVWQRHETHGVVALWHLMTYAEPEATGRLRVGIQRYNAAHGIVTTPTAGYHETLTLASIQFILAYLDRAEKHLDLPQLAAGLLDIFPNSKVLLNFYSRERIMSPEARAGWVAPDLAPIRPVAPSPGLRPAARADT